MPTAWPTAAPGRCMLPAVAARAEDEYVRIAGLVGPGEWCTYGDISTATRGDARAARAVGRAAAAHPGFPAAHRVLRSGGTIPEEWGAAQGLGRPSAAAAWRPRASPSPPTAGPAPSSG